MLALALPVLLVAPTGIAAAATGGPDQGFGFHGLTTIDLENHGDAAGPVATLPDGRVVATSSGLVASRRVVTVRRLLPDGRPDPTYGAGGRVDVATAAGGTPDHLEVLPDGRAYVGIWSNYPRQLEIVRLTADGRVDPGFRVLLLEAPFTNPFAVDGDGGVVTVVVDGIERRAVRFHADGSADTEWGDGGSTLLGTIEPDDVRAEQLSAIVRMPDGRYALVLTATTTERQTHLTFLDADGALAGTAGLGGHVNDVDLDDSGRLIVLRHDTIERRLPDGSLDPTFGPVPLATDWIRRDDHPRFHTVDATGGLIALAGTTSPWTDEDHDRGYVAVLDDDGRALAGGANPAGEVGLVVDLVPESDAPFTGVALRPDDGLGTVVVGATVAGADVATAALHTDGSLVPGFGDGGLVNANFAVEGFDIVLDAATDGAGRTYVLGVTRWVTGAVLVRLRADGALDPTFDDDGRVRLLTEQRGLLVQPDGAVLVVGHDEGLRRVPARLTVTPIADDGTVGPTARHPYGVDPDWTTEATTVTPTGDGGAVVALRRTARNTADRIHLLRLLPGGGPAPDQPTTGVDAGLVLLETVTSLPDGGVGLVGRVLSSKGPFVLRRLLPTFEPDPAYGADGTVVVDLGSTYGGTGAFTPDGSAIVSRDRQLLRFDPSGAPAGSVSLDASAIVALPDGGALVTRPDGMVTTRVDRDLAVVTGFGADGKVAMPHDPVLRFGPGGTLVAAGGVEDDPWGAPIAVTRLLLDDDASFPELTVADTTVDVPSDGRSSGQQTARIAVRLSRPLAHDLQVSMLFPFTSRGTALLPAGATEGVVLIRMPSFQWPLAGTVVRATVEAVGPGEGRVRVVDGDAAVTLRVLPPAPTTTSTTSTTVASTTTSTTVAPTTTASTSTTVAPPSSTTSTTAAPPPASTSTTTPPTVPPPAGPAVVRVAGADRIATAVAVSAARPGRSVDAVVLTRADGYADALAGTPLAARLRAPLLMTPSGTLDGRVVAEIQRVLRPGGRVVILGGPGAVASSVDGQLAALGYSVGRYAGRDRYETAALIAVQGLGSPRQVVVATGTTFADSLAAGTAAASVGGALLLTDGPTLPRATAAYLASVPGATVTAVGGPAAAALPSARALVGADRYDTAVRVAEAFFGSDLVAVGMASGTNFPDALAGGAAVATAGGPMLLARPDGVPPVVRDYLAARRVAHVLVFGGPGAVAEP